MNERLCRRCKTGDASGSPQRGTHANLCPACIDELRARKSETATKAWADKRARGETTSKSYTSRTGEAGQETFEAKAKVLVSYGRQLDRRIEDVKKTKRGHLDAISLARESMEQFKAACLRLAESAGG